MAIRQVRVFTDGSALRNPGPSGWAWWAHDGSWSAGPLPHGTNQQAELIAILMALRSVPLDARLEIVSDSQYAINSATKWIDGWKRAGWLTAGRKPVANLTIMKKLDEAMAARVAPWTATWVKGHSGVAGNERADRLANDAAQAAKSGKKALLGPGWTSFTAPPVTPKTPAPRVSRPAARTAPAQRAEVKMLGLCTACGTPIHPISLECRCSR